MRFLKMVKMDLKVSTCEALLKLTTSKANQGVNLSRGALLGIPGHPGQGQGGGLLDRRK